MVKIKEIWVCSSCGHSQVKWSGQCSQCKEWNVMESKVETPNKRGGSPVKKLSSLKQWKLSEGLSLPFDRLKTGLSEFDRLMGGGLVPGSISLIGGDPGIGKSTLLLQVAAALAQKNQTVLYVSGEESIPQVCLRAERLGIKSDSLLLINETEVQTIKAHVEATKPSLVIIDSIQIVYKEELGGAPGSVSQVRECGAEFLHQAKSLNTAFFLIGHVTKSGEIAGPRILEHMVDTVLHFEGDHRGGLRLLRGLKNRFGTTDELALFQMLKEGLKEVENPSALFLNEREQYPQGSAIIPSIEGSRALLIEAQALVTKSFYPQPTRKCTGFDPNRLALLLAILEKRAKISLNQCDVFVSIAGGLKISEPAMDLGIVSAIVSSFTNQAIDPKLAVLGELGLAGEVRPISRIELRLKELKALGFEKVILPKKCEKAASRTDLKAYPVETLEEALHVLIPQSK